MEARDAQCRVRAASPSDVVPAARVLASAFEHYPWTRWTVDERRHVERLAQLYELVLGRVAVPYGAVWVCEQAVGDGHELVGVAGWLTPSTDPPGSVWHEVAAAEARLRGSRMRAHERAEAQLQPVRPEGPHWLLGTVGVLPAHQGRGIATRLLRPGLRAADIEGVDACLETSDVRNVRLYRRLGFDVTDVVPVSDGGPTVWLMRRRPAR